MAVLGNKFNASAVLLSLLLLLCVTPSLTAPTTTTLEPGSGSSESDETTEMADTTVAPPEEEENTPLEKSLEQFLGLIPSEKIRNMTGTAYLESDAVQRSFNFLRGREFLDAKDKLLEAAEVQEFVKFLNQSGVNVVRLVRKVSNLTGIPATLRNGEEPDSDESESEEASDEGTEAANVVSQLVDKVLAELPQEQFFSIFFEKMESDSEFSEFVERLNGDEFEGILLKLQESKALDAFQKKMSDHNVNLEKIWTSMKIFFGWGNNF